MTKKGHQKFWQMKRHIFSGKIHMEKCQLQNFFLSFEIGGNASLSQRWWTPLTLLITPVYQPVVLFCQINQSIFRSNYIQV